MLTNLNCRAYGPKAAAALMCALGLAIGGSSLVSAEPDLAPAATVESVRFADSAPIADTEVEVRMAVESFIRGMSSGDAETVWMFASEEDQEAFATEAAVYEAFAETFPAFTQVAEVTFESFRQEGETPFVELSMTGKDGQRHRAAIGLWLDDAGDWEIVSCEVKPVSAPVPEHVAAL